MTDSITATSSDARQERPGKRVRLTDAAAQLFYEQGVERTSLAHIAAAADVPVGNVYYYFKTKDDIIEAVVSQRVEYLQATVAALGERHRTPAGRLKGFVKELSGEGEMLALNGCPFGTLCTELAKRAAGHEPMAAQLLRVPVEWAERQFKEMGCADARGLALQLIGAYQGAAVLTHALDSPSLVRREARRMEHWIDSLRN